MVFIMPGVHFDGPDDVRLDRFARVMAGTGRAVVVPFLPDYLRLRPTEAVFSDADEFVQAALASEHRPDRRPALLFSISFGSLPAFYIASREHAEQFSALVTFGGYGVWAPAVRFALCGDVRSGVEHPDPLNRPVVALNLCDQVEEMAPHVAQLRPAWREFCRQTWGRPEMKLRENFVPVAKGLADRLPDEVQDYFLMGCGARDGGVERLMEALAVGDWEHLDPVQFISEIRIPLHVIHGRSDDVIPHTQVESILEACPPEHPVRAYKTGLYSHTGSESGGSSPAAQIDEYRTMAGMLLALAL
ncbi:MAG: pimeloyl-ACP methyl ester carboxylesterase [Bradymonadia bacterium]|jgi:pimeloyl-ACP methyl ester carboxylesterase